MATLDTTGVYTEGDDFRVIKALGVPFGSYTLDCIAGCMNDLEVMSVTAATDLVALLNAYDVANTSQSTQNLEQADGQKVLVKADVLEWEVTNGGVGGAGQEKLKIKDEIAQIMSFCVCLGGFLGNPGGGTALIRS